MSTTETPRFVIDGREYEVPSNLTLGELRLLKREFGVSDVSPEALTERQNDPDYIAGMLYVSIRRAEPSFTIEQLDAIDATAIDFAGDEPEAEAAPPHEGEGAAE